MFARAKKIVNRALALIFQGLPYMPELQLTLEPTSLYIYHFWCAIQDNDTGHNLLRIEIYFMCCEYLQTFFYFGLESNKFLFIYFAFPPSLLFFRVQVNINN